jgi:hypothetical protein
VIHWHIGGGSDGGTAEYETVIRNGACDVHRGVQSDSPAGDLQDRRRRFLRLVTGNAAGPMLFMSGKPGIEGDMMIAAGAASLFTIPKG